MSYVPLVYLQDLIALLDELALPKFIGIGTSLGGIMLMLLATTRGGQMAGALLNDIGPELAQSGLDRIKSHVGTGGPQPTWVHAARAVAEAQRIVYPKWRLQDWLRIAKRLYRLNSQGRMVLDYDQRIAEPFRVPGGEAGVNLWPAFDAMAHIPLTLVRGANSDLLSAEIAAAMKARMPSMDLVEVPRVGHAPTLEEPEAVAAIDQLLVRSVAQMAVAP
jgi:pimeloyl-ACP methyl ester carboxylesterase